MPTRTPWLLPAVPGVFALLALVVHPRAAAAQRLVYHEDFESGISHWVAVSGAAPVVATDSTTAVCSSHFERETILGSGGRVFTAASVAVTGGARYCLTAWVRGSTGTQPFLGINLSDATATHGAEHWLIGHVPWANGYGGDVVNAPADGAWHWLAAPFTLEAGANYLVLKDELFVGGTAGTADFDDISLYADSCPTVPSGSVHAACVGVTPVCTAGGACVQCAAPSGCSGVTPVCDVAAGRCVACSVSDTRGCAASGAGTACVAGACGCAADADCGGARSGRVCDGGTHRCVAGCAASPARNGCSAGQFCTSADLTGTMLGRCTTTCNFDGDCLTSMPTRPLCASGDGGPSACVQCRVDTDCAGMPAGRTLCDVTTGVCAECTRSRTTACAAGMRGSACLAMGTCGCTADSDCGDAMSGRVCDPMASACLPGCRATDGSGCPAGMACTVAPASTVGTCALVPLDAGTDAAMDAVSDATPDAGTDASTDTRAGDLGPTDEGPQGTDAGAATDTGVSTDTGGQVTDSGSPASTDASSSDGGADSDGGVPAAAPASGCGCGVPVTHGTPSLASLALLALVAGGRRRWLAPRHRGGSRRGNRGTAEEE